MTARGEATRARLIAATQQVVRDAGYANATTRAVAEAAGVSEGTIYRHFPDKLTLLLAAARHGNEAVIESVEKLPARAGTASVQENLTDALTQLATLRDDVIPLEMAILADPELATRRRELVASVTAREIPGPHQPLAAYLRAEQEYGRVRADLDADRCAVLVLAALLGLAIVAPAGEVPDREQVAAAVDVVVRGLI